jgi:hypothetical protein
MVNVYTDYVKELHDYIYGLFEVSPDETTVRLEYRFSDYKAAKVAQQQNLIDVMKSAGVLKVLSRIDLPPMKQIEMSMHGNEYSAAGCAGYVFEVNKDAFMSHRASTRLVKPLNDEHEYNMPHLSDDGQILHVNSFGFNLGKSVKNKELLKLIFESDTYSCTESDFAETGGAKAMLDPVKYASDTVYYLNNKIEQKTGLTDFLTRSNKAVGLNHRFFD